MFGKSYQDSTSNENSSQSIIIFIIYLLPRNFKYGIGLSLHIFYIMVLLRFHSMCLYAKLIMSYLLIVFMFIIFRFNHGIFSPLIAILNQNKLTGPNYVDWKRNLDIVLIIEEHRFVLSEPCLDFPALDASSEERQRYYHWRKSNEMAKCYALTSISNVLQHQMQDVELALDIMFSLKEMFGEQGRSARQDTMMLLLNTKMSRGTLVREHCLKMISYLNTLEVLGANIDGESQVDMILQSLPKSFKEFKLNYNMNKKIYTLSELMKELVAAEGILVKVGIDTNMTETSSFKPK